MTRQAPEDQARPPEELVRLFPALGAAAQKGTPEVDLAAQKHGRSRPQSLQVGGEIGRRPAVIAKEVTDLSPYGEATRDAVAVRVVPRAELPVVGQALVDLGERRRVLFPTPSSRIAWRRPTSS